MFDPTRGSTRPVDVSGVECSYNTMQVSAAESTRPTTLQNSLIF